MSKINIRFETLKCHYCNSFYSTPNFLTSEQKFCSIDCRNKASKKQKMDKLKNQLRNEVQNKREQPTSSFENYFWPVLYITFLYLVFKLLDSIFF
jgi:hypothetical protein